MWRHGHGMTRAMACRPASKLPVDAASATIAVQI